MRISMPVILNEPLGILQRSCEQLNNFPLLEEAGAATEDPGLRLAMLGLFQIS